MLFLRLWLCVLVSSLLLPVVSPAQNAAAVMPTPRFQALDANGYPLAGGYVYTYQAGTTTPLASYTNAAGTVPNANPVILDSSGSAGIWLTANTPYKIIVQDASHAQLYSTDNVVATSPAAAPTATSINYTASYSGAVARTLASKMGESVSVMDFGAKGDAATDDRLAIQAGLNALQATCGTLVFPAGKTFLIGSNPGGTAMITYRPCVSMNGGGTIKLGPGLGTFKTVFEGLTTMQPATISNLSFDMNGTGNQITVDPTSNNNYQILFHMPAPPPTGYGMTFRDCTFLNGHGVWTIDTYGQQVSVLNCHWVNWGVGSTLLFDQSVIYLAGDNATVTGNTFDGQGTAAHTAIEVHASTKTITNNVINRFYSGIIFSADQNNTGTARNIVIAHNTISQTWYGVQFWSTDGLVNGLTISGNVINLDRTYNNGVWIAGLGGGESGIETYVNSNHDISNLSIIGNTINWATEPSTYPTNSFQAGIGLYTASGGTMSNVNVLGNIVNNCPGPGIGVGLSSAASNIKIQGNTVTNPGKSPQINLNFRAGILMTATPSWSNSLVADNTLSDTQATPTMQRGILFGGTAGDNAASIYMARNRVSYTGTPNQFFNIQTSSPNFDLLVPGYAGNSALLSLTGFTSGNYPPRFSAITDESTGRVWRNLTSQASPAYFSSQELRDTIPTSGSYNQGDIVWAADSAIAGFAGWVNVLTGTPGTFAKMVLTNAGTNSPFTSNVAAPGFTAGSSAGLSVTKIVKGSDGNNCNLVILGGIITGTTCP